MMAADIDTAVLRDWLCGNVPGLEGGIEIEKFPGGQSNPTYRIVGPAGRYVLRRKPFGELLPSAHAVDREYRLLSALHPQGYPVPRPILLCDDNMVIGSMFYLMEMVDGVTCWDGLLPDVQKENRRAHYEALVDTLAALHMIDHEAIGLADFGASGNYVARQVQRWTKQYRAAQTDDIPEVEKLIEWLPSTLPEQAGRGIIHGDYRIDNVIYAQNSSRIIGVLDWELATIGDPLADFAYFAMSWVMPPDGRAGLHGVDFEATGIPTLEQIVSRYCAVTGRSEDLSDLHWYFSYNLFRLVGIIQGIKKRVIDGNASSPVALETIANLEPFARIAWAQAKLAGATD
jgi:aminoglycoside phosphotransferase (APT) family kinase protein